ncbi:hypothetical protein [Aporhodopirellula aestuarii]|uniref:Uncharacterized protein n=1 Tax=Aporhodopirellula aestuarii TaxID=2950107 RepID=A0ABT0UAB4_9BACT|nr:hypothetical protein [Aporhodopirellula aestuarii]MCM2373805.1 hypothetical protein [Aporhodopirellula aestuarii]
MKIRADVDRRWRRGEVSAAVPVAAAIMRPRPKLALVLALAALLGAVSNSRSSLVAEQATAYARATEGTTEAAAGIEAGHPVNSTLPDAGGVIEHIGPAGLKTYRWDFSRSGDVDFDRWPDLFTRHVETGYPEYVRILISARDEELESNVLALDTAILLKWPQVRRALRWLPGAEKLPPLPPSLNDLLVDRCVTVKLDGGQARITSPSLPTSRRFQYRFSVDVFTQNLTHDSVYAQVIFYDEEDNELQRNSTPAVTRTPRWRSLVIESLMPPRGARKMRVTLNVMGGEDGLQDIRGVVSFDNITFRQFPQMKITTDHPFGVYRRGESITATTQLMGLPSEPTRVRLRLLDHNENELQSASKELTIQDINSPAPENTAAPVAPGEIVFSTNSGASGADRDSLWFDWALGALPPGYYIVDAAMENERGASLSNRSTFVVVDRLTDDPREWSPPSTSDAPGNDAANGFSAFTSAESELESLPFGWTMPPELVERYRTKDVSGKVISQWLRNVGVGWAKLPVWFAPDDTLSADTAATLASRLRDVGIQPVGLLDQPKDEFQKEYRLRERSDQRAATFLNDPVVWRPQLDTIMNRMTFRIRMWQIGDDTDFSFQELPDLADKISILAEGLQGFGQPLEIVVPWTWLDQSPNISGDSWKGVIRHTGQPLTATELDTMLDMEEARAGETRYPPMPSAPLSFTSAPSTRSSSAVLPTPNRGGRQGDTWITIDPLPAKRYDRDTRIADLVLRMATVRGHKVEAAFVRRPFAPESTLVKSDWHPDDLLLPWRTTSLLLGRARNIGSLRMRGGSNNIVFRSSHSSVILIWGDTPRTERLFLGDNVYQVDVWGRRSELDTELVDGQLIHRVEVDRVPKFLVGIDPALAEFRMSVDIDERRIDALLGREQSISIRYKNPIGQSLVGSIALEPPPAWSISPVEQEWDLNSFEKGQSNFTVVLGNNATIGRFELPIAIQFATSPPTKIRVYRQIEVGPEGFDLVVTSRLMGDRLRVKIEMTNQTRRTANFDCLLFAGSTRQYERRVLAIGPGETSERNIDWPNGQNLVGQQMLLRAIEQEGNRVINHTFTVVP